MSRRRTVGAVIAGAVFLGLAVLVFVGCSPLTIASWQAAPALRDVVGDRGDVFVNVDEPKINFTGYCTLSVRLNEDVTHDDIVDVFSRVEGTTGDGDCVVGSVRMDNGSEALITDWRRIPDDAWDAIAERIMRVPGVRFSSVGEFPPIVSVYENSGGLADFATTVREVTAGDRLEDVLGPVNWSLLLNGGGPPYVDVDIEVGATPGSELADFIDDLADFSGPAGIYSGDLDVKIFEGDSDSAGDGGAVTRIKLALWEPKYEGELEAATAAVVDAFAAAGLPGKLVVVSGDETPLFDAAESG